MEKLPQLAHGIPVSKASSTLAGLAEMIQMALEEYKKKGLQLSEGIRVTDRKNLQVEIESMKLRLREKRTDFFDTARDLLLEASNEWFAFFHLQY